MKIGRAADGFTKWAEMLVMYAHFVMVQKIGVRILIRIYKDMLNNG